MTDANETHAPERRGDESVVLMYPDNQLTSPIREYEDTFSALTVLRETFFPTK